MLRETSIVLSLGKLFIDNQRPPADVRTICINKRTFAELLSESESG